MGGAIIVVGGVIDLPLPFPLLLPLPLPLQLPLPLNLALSLPLLLLLHLPHSLQFQILFADLSSLNGQNIQDIFKFPPSKKKNHDKPLAMDFFP